ncbi:MAG: pilus assembly protein CpaF [Thermoleophilaceae bacterium]|nr:pilus assembly protein CpaF [Thermoleophilaceae bacterium]
MSPEPTLVDRLHSLVLADRPADADLRGRIAELARREAPLLEQPALVGVVDAVAARTVGLGPLDAVLADRTLTEVMVHGAGEVWVERAGRLRRLDVRLEASEVELLVERVVAPLGLRVDRSSPLVDARLADGSRVNIVVPPLALDGPCMTIRRFGTRPIPLEEIAAPGVAALLRWAVAARANVVVSGGTGAGKTTLLNALAGCIPAGERVVTIEDAAELRLPLEHVVRLEARPPNAEGAGEVRVRTLVRNALRMRPDRIVVGEVRGAEALDMLQAMNTGHEGSLSTCHANSPADALRRLETMVVSGASAMPLAAVREQIASALDLVVQVARVDEGRRQVTAVDEVVALGDEAGTAPLAVRRLASPRGVVALPIRPPRAAVAPLDPAWVGS